jgi:multiple sugar transport system permease protein
MMAEGCPTQRESKRARGLRLRLFREVPLGTLLALPVQFIVLVFAVAPTLITLWLSLTAWQPTDNIPWYKAEVQGFWNFSDLLSDERFVSAVFRTLFVVTVCVSVELVLAVALALLFLDEWPWRKAAVSVLILPMMVVPVDAANSFFMLFGDHGPVNQLLSLVLRRPVEFAWLADPRCALLPIMLAEVWQWTPMMFLLVLTGLLNVPRNQWRAALSLGANPVRAFFHIVLPYSLPVILVAVLIRAIETFKIFDVIYILTRGGPGAETESISMFMYNGAFVYFRIGYIAAAALMVLFVVIAVCLALYKPLQKHHA